MKIAFITHVFPRLHNTFIQNEIIELLKRGHDVSIFSVYRAEDEVVNEKVIQHGLLERTYYYKDFISLKSRILNRFRKNGNYWQYFQRQEKILEPIIKLFEKEKFDVIHAGFNGICATTGMVLSEITNIPFTFECHSLFGEFPFSREKIEKASKIFAISNYNKKLLIEKYGCPADKIVVKRVPFNKEFCDQISNIKTKENLIVSVCRLDPKKGLEYAIEAFSLVFGRRKDLKYLIVGDGPLCKSLKEKVRKMGLSREVKFSGDVTNTMALIYLKQATVSILPSVVAKDGDIDGIPTSLIEAMYLKTPCIGTSISGIPELIDDGINGYVVESRNVGQLAERMELLLENKLLREKMGEESREKVEDEFAVDKNTNKLISRWKEVLLDN